MEIILFALVGWAVGVAINRTADNLPAQRSLLEAPCCLHCSTPRPIVEQSGFVANLLRQRCRNCGAPMPLRAPIVEIASALLFFFLWTRYGPGVQLVLASIYTAVFLLVLVTDLEHRLIFNVVILPAAVFAAVTSPVAQIGPRSSLLGGVTAFAIVFAIYLFAEVFSRLRHLQVPGGAFGQGDVKLAVFMGLVTGFPAVLLAILYTILLGGVGALAFLAYHLVVHRRLALTTAIPYGPFFCIAGWAIMIFGT
ncbi:MAG: A24 family peptidase [Chloroflexi bacterium]|nr:A24 family peptidase [Chloroflexota bacterium]